MKYIKKLSKYRNWILIILDCACIFFAYYFGTVIASDSIVDFSDRYLIRLVISSILYFIIFEMIFLITRRNKNIIRYEEGKDYIVYIAICLVTACILSLVQKIFNSSDIASVKMNILVAIVISIMIVAYRIIAKYILVNDIVNNGIMIRQKDNRKKVLIIGAGNAAHEIIKTINADFKYDYDIVGIIDDNKNRLNFSVSGVKIIGNRNDIIEICEKNKVDQIFFSIARIDIENKREILNICQKTNAKVRVLPGIREIIHNKNLFNSLRNVEIEDILGRDAVKLDNTNIQSLIKNNTILVTGGGGSIGSELCRQIMSYKPKKLVMLDIYENSLYDIEVELKHKYPEAKIDAVIASIRDEKRLDEIFETYKPYLVFHAAAHKHVPLMEHNPIEAIKNNVFGTYNVVNACDKYKVKKFILISSDKAVNPTNIMGATKRMCEMIVQAKNKESETEFAAVRFGNVLGSNGSVIPLFKKQIANGGPVTVTHKEITRFFMTIPEAVGLVLQAMTYANGGEIFVLDMGEPIKIYDLAESLIKLSGLSLNKDIKIEITGLRPGEKLYEEILMNEEGLEKTRHNKIFVAEPMDITMKDIKNKLEKFNVLINNDNVDINEVKNTMKEVVPTFSEPELLNSKKEG